MMIDGDTMVSNADTSLKQSCNELPESEATIQKFNKLSYMQRPPRIEPNYGNKYKRGAKLKTKVNRVLLYDNVTQQTILQTQISYIESQCYKTKRQLETSLKAFILQRQQKDKALRKLTKIHHADDYEQFELDYYTNTSNIIDNRPTYATRRLVLPSIQKHNEAGALSLNTGGSINKRLCSLNTDKCGCNDDVLSNHGNKFCEYSQIDNSVEITHLPSITSFLPVSLTAEQHHNRPDVHLEQQENLTFLAKKNYNKMTEGRHNTNRLSICKEDRATSDHFNNQSCNENILNTSVLLDIDNFKKTETSLFKTINKRPKGLSIDLENISRSPRAPITDPFLDARFELLQQVLVPQYPPSEGFIELSPSFVKRYSLTERAITLNKKKH